MATPPDENVGSTVAFSVLSDICWEAAEYNLGDDAVRIKLPEAMFVIEQSLIIAGKHETSKEAAKAALSELRRNATEYLTHADCIECRNRIRHPRTISEDSAVNLSMLQLSGVEIMCRIFGVVPETSVDMLLGIIIKGYGAFACNHYDPDSKKLFERVITSCNIIETHIVGM
jgi:hypothetical protein